MFADRVLSGMRPTGPHAYRPITMARSRTGCKLQEEYECLFFAADWHALTTHYDSAGDDRGIGLGDVHRLARRGHRSRRARRSSSSRACRSTPS